MRFTERLLNRLRSAAAPGPVWVIRQEQAYAPRCSREVVIACPEYGDARYRCEIRLATPLLYQWAEQRLHWARQGRDASRDAWEGLAAWLARADLLDERPSQIPAELHALLSDAIPDWVRNGQARIYCDRCAAWVSDVEEAAMDRGRDGVWHVWTDRWSCPGGHCLHEERQAMHLQYRRS